MAKKKGTEFAPDPGGNQILFAANLSAVESALEKLEAARFKLEAAHRKRGRIALQTEAEKDYDEAIERVKWFKLW